MYRSLFSIVMIVAIGVPSTLALAADPYAIPASVFTTNVPAKRAALARLRAQFVAHPPRVSHDAHQPKKLDAYQKLLDANGVFTDLPTDWKTNLNRLNALAAGRGASPRLLLAVQRYGNLMVAKPDPFVGAAFEGPRDAAAIYFSLFKTLQLPQNVAVKKVVLAALFMCWHHPIEKDWDRKDHPYSIEVFRHDGHYVVGNFTYRPVVECAVAMDDTKLMDVVKAVTEKSLVNRTSFDTTATDFWGDQGLTPDGNGFAHGRQSYLYGYIKDWLNGVIINSNQLANTPWAIPKSAWNNPADMILDGQQWYAYRGDLDWSVEGRHNMHPGLVLDTDPVLLHSIEGVLKCSDGQVARKTELQKLAAELKDHRHALAGDRWFWNTEDLIHRGNDFYMSVNLSSQRSNGPEIAAPSSIVNYGFAFGAMMIKTAGDEYTRARGAINYAALPGTTTNPHAAVPTKTNWNGAHNNSPFCGGVSDGQNGACGFILQRDEMNDTAHKSYFAFQDGGLLALGAGVGTGPHVTTLNQTERRGPIETGGFDSPPSLDADGTHTFSLTHPAWLLHDHVGYLIVARSPSIIQVSSETRQTRWAQLAPLNARRPAAATSPERIFELAIAHPAGHDTYAYRLIPNATKDSLQREIKTPTVTILSNTTTVQAARDGDVIEAVFYAAGSFNSDGVSLSSDGPAVLLLTHSTAGWSIRAADPLQRPGRTSVTLGGIVHATLQFPRPPVAGSAAVVKASHR